jgi:hypothetical protein
MQPASAEDLIESTAIAANAIPGTGNTRDLAVRLSGTPLQSFDLVGGRQTLSGDTLRVRMETPLQMRAPWRLNERARGFRERFAAELQEEPLLQTTNRDIVNLAVRIAGNERDPRVKMMVLLGEVGGVEFVIAASDVSDCHNLMRFVGHVCATVVVYVDDTGII